jgi:hypothetical protein
MTEPERSEKHCPACAELILASANKCKHCGEWIHHPTLPNPNSILEQQQNYGVPFRLERHQQTSTTGGFSTTSSSVGFAVQGEVCPKCKIASYSNEYTIWHWLLAIFFFPIGLLVLFFPVKTCSKCNMPFGAGKKMAETVRLIATVYLAFIILVIFGFCAIAVLAR